MDNDLCCIETDFTYFEYIFPPALRATLGAQKPKGNGGAEISFLFNFE
jgi:hypothetical protein